MEGSLAQFVLFGFTLFRGFVNSLSIGLDMRFGSWQLILCCILVAATCDDSKERQKRGLIFPPTSLYGTFVAIAVPIDIPDKNVFVSYNFEANYAPVTNITEIDEVLFPNLPVISSRQSRSITRELAYTVLETRFKQHGMNGRECMLRNICEAAETPLHHNGLLGHIMHIIFTPSSSREEGLDDSYYEAEADGLRGDCDKYIDDCPFSLFDVITRLVEIRHGRAEEWTEDENHL